MKMMTMVRTSIQRHITRQRGAVQQRRCYHELSYACFGDPATVLSYQSDPTIVDDDPPLLLAPPDDESDLLVQVEMLHVPWNPADVNMVQGKYPSPYDSTKNPRSSPNNKSRHFEGRTVSGSEGWGRIVASRSSSSLPEGSLVMVAKPGLGTLRSSLWVPESALLRVPEELVLVLDQHNDDQQLGGGGPAAKGSTLFQLGGTALRLLSDFVRLAPGDVVLQNAGNSGVGLLVSQLASALFGTRVVSLVRRDEHKRTPEEFDVLVDHLKTVGKNALVVAEEDLLLDPQARKDFDRQLRELSGSGQSLPKLALNAVGGTSAKSLLHALDPGGTMVTYGGMSGEPVSVATPQLIFKDVRVMGYWHSRWMIQQSHSAKEQMVDTLVHAVKDHHVECPPCQVFALHDVQAALHWQSSGQGAIRRKLVFDCQEHAGV
jgi:trans-2-enoyl-CoA reductase